MQHLHQCLSWLARRRFWLLGGGGLVMLILVERLGTIGLLAGLTPLALGIACLLPCAIPLLLLRRRPAADSAACGCETCSEAEQPHGSV